MVRRSRQAAVKPLGGAARRWLHLSLGLRRPRTIQSALIWLVIVSIVPAWGATALFIYQYYERGRVNVARDTVATARALTQAVDRELRGARLALEVLAKSRSLIAGDLASFYDRAQEMLPGLTGSNIVLIAPDGKQVINTLRPFGEKLSSDKEPPELLRPFATGEPQISDLFSGTLTNRKVVAVEVPVVSKGATIYLLATGIFPDQLAEILHQQQVPSTWVAAIFDGNGTIVARTQRADEYVGRKGSAALIRRMSEISEGVIETETLEGIPVFSSFSRSAFSGWAVAIGVPTSEAFGPLRRSLWLSITSASVFLLLCLSLARLISRHIAGSIEVLAKHAAELGESKPIAIPPLGITHADQVAKAMVKASQVLRQRAAEREAAEQTERRLLLAKHDAEQANRAKSDFLAVISHEIRTPLTSVIGLMELLVDSELTERQRHQAMLAKDAGESLLAIVNDLLDMSKIEAGKLELEHAPLKPTEVAEAALAIVRPQAAAKNIELRRTMAGDLPAWINGDATRLRQILLNLLSNAVKFTERGTITLRIAREQRADAMQLRFEVADTGIGVDTALQDRLFQRFSQLGPSGNRPRGTGLGLAISRQLVEAMGGTIGVQSHVGEGSVFWFTMPYEEASSPATTAPVEPPLATGSCARILVAEDQYMIRELMETILAEAGYEVVLVRNGVEAIEALERSDFDMVLMDVEMPEMDGLTATRRIRQMGDRGRNVPIVAVTAHATAGDIERCRSAGISEHLSKPTKRKELLRVIERWLGSKPVLAEGRE